MRAVVTALIGAAATIACAGHARRRSVAARLRASAPRPWMPHRVRAWLTTALDDAGVHAPPEEAVEMWLTISLTTALVGVAFGPAFGGMAGTITLIGVPVALVSARPQRARRIASAIPDALERVGAELRGGGTVPTAVAALAHGDGPLASDFARVETRVGLGASLPVALHAWAHERPVPGVEAAAGALALSASVGGHAAGALDGLASSLRDRLAVAAEARALSAQARYSALVIGLAPIGYLAATSLFDPRSLQSLLGTGAGRVCAALGLGLEALGAVWMRVILRGGDAW